jgi:hypothetical protein
MELTVSVEKALTPAPVPGTALLMEDTVRVEMLSVVPIMELANSVDAVVILEADTKELTASVEKMPVPGALLLIDDTVRVDRTRPLAIILDITMVEPLNVDPINVETVMVEPVRVDRTSLFAAMAEPLNVEPNSVETVMVLPSIVE